MISKEETMDIIGMKRIKNFSIRHICRLTGRHRKTITKYIERNALPEYTKRKRATSILDPYYQIIRDYLEDDNYQATWIHEESFA